MRAHIPSPQTHLISGDENMIDALTTPGKDLHTITAIESFSLTRLLSDGVTPVDDDWALQQARSDSEAYEKIEATFLYRTTSGKMMTHGEFKDSIRVAAKAINFGIPYGRGAAAIATQIEAWTGNPVNVQDIQSALDGWKRTYSKACATTTLSSRAMSSPHGDAGGTSLRSPRNGWWRPISEKAGISRSNRRLPTRCDWRCHVSYAYETKNNCSSNS